MLVNLLCPFGFGFDGTLKHAFKGAHVAKRDTVTPLNAVWELEYHTFLWFLTQVKVTEKVYSCISCVKMTDVKGLAECSFNVNGISNGQKRKDILDYLRQHNYGIYLLQKTRMKVESENFLRAAWGLNVWVAGSETNRNEVAILFNSNFEYKVHSVV